MNVAFLFPGQGSQSVGMARDLFENFSIAKQVFEKYFRLEPSSPTKVATSPKETQHDD